MRAHSPWKEPPWGTWTEGGSAVEEVRDGSHWVFDGGARMGVVACGCIREWGLCTGSLGIALLERAVGFNIVFSELELR